MNEYIGKSGLGNHILYKMCAEYPNHNDPEIVGDKLWLIGRAYAAAVERKAGEDFDWKPLKREIASSDIDQRIQRCRQIDRIDKSNLSEILETHKFLVDIFKRNTGLCKRSLASKYLHFHAPNAFFIYDSKASGRVKKQVTGFAERLRVECASDRQYEIFCRQCIIYREKVLEAGPENKVIKISPRYLDSTLMNYRAEP